jgi:hypothetical protein
MISTLSRVTFLEFASVVAAAALLGFLDQLVERPDSSVIDRVISSALWSVLMFIKAVVLHIFSSRYVSWGIVAVIVRVCWRLMVAAPSGVSPINS